MSDIGVGIVGYGLAGRIFHKMLVDSTDGLRVAAIMSRSQDKLDRARAENPQAAILDDFEALLARPDVDLVVLATPHHIHCDQTVAALEAGKPVVVDKIMACSVAEADTMIAAANRAGKLLSVFHNRRWDSDFLTVKAAIESGLLGDVWTVDIAVARPNMPLKPLTGDKRWRATAEAFGGQIVDWGAHLMDQAVLLGGGDPDRVYCDLQYRHLGNETDSEGFAVLHYPGDLRITVMASVQTWIERPHWHIHGSDGGLRIWGIDPQEGYTRQHEAVASGTAAACLPAESVEIKSLHPTDNFKPLPGNWVGFYENVRDALLGQAYLAVTPDQCRDALRVYERCFRAAGVSNQATTSRGCGMLG